MSNITDILFNCLINGRLSPFYIIHGSSSNSTDLKVELDLFADNLLTKILSSLKNISIENAKELKVGGHPDILTITPENPDKEYTTFDFKEFFTFMNFSPIELKHRLVVVYMSEKIGVILSNKLLKSLEDAPAHTSIIFLSPKNYSFIKTIESRAISLKLPPKNETERVIPHFTGDNQAAFYRWCKGEVERQNISPLVSSTLLSYLSCLLEGKDYIPNTKLDKETAREIFKLLVELNCYNHTNYKQKVNFLEGIRSFINSETFNNSPNIRALSLMHHFIN